jgi:hypothetical protein
MDTKRLNSQELVNLLKDGLENLTQILQAMVERGVESTIIIRDSEGNAIQSLTVNSVEFGSFELIDATQNRKLTI